MADVILRAFSFLLAMVAGWASRACGVIDERGSLTLKQVILCVTLPAAIVNNFSHVPQLDASLLSISLLAVVVILLMIVVAMFLTRGKSNAEKTLYLFSLQGYNIGTFCLPFVQGFLPPLCGVAACVFEIGNNFMCTGGSYAIARAWLDGKRTGLRSILTRLLGAPTILACLLMLALSLAGLHLPKGVLTLIRPMVDANAFLAMFYLGVVFRLELKPEYLSEIARLVLLRQVSAFLFAAAVYLVLPYSPDVKKALTLIFFSPMSAIAPAWTQACGGDAGKAGAANGVSIVFSLAEMTAILAWFNF